MNRKNLVFIMVVLISLMFVFAAESGPKGVNSNPPDLGAKTKDIFPGSDVKGVKPDIDFGKIPLYFVSNRGQVNEKAKFYARASRYTLWLTREGLVFDGIKKQDTGEKKEDSPFTPHQSPTTKHERDVSRLMFIGANRDPEMKSIKPAALKVNYFIGNDRSKWNCDVPTSLAVQYRNLYKNIDLQVYGIEKQIEYDWVVRPGGDPAAIRFAYKDIKGTRIDKDGNLVIETRFGELIHKKPIGYQVIDSKKQAVDVHFKKIGRDRYGFSVGQYDKSYDLIIDPLVLVYSTYLGGGSSDFGHGIAVDGSGNAYVTGFTCSTDFPTLNPYQTYQGLQDVFVIKLDPSQSGAAGLLYSTYLGGGSYDSGLDIAVDGSGHAYVTGSTESTDFPTLHQYQTYQGSRDVFFIKLDPSQSGATSLLYSTYLGGGDYEYGSGIAIDGSGNAYVTGFTESTDFPTLHPYQAYQGWGDGFVAKLDPSQIGASSLLYSTYLGGSDSDDGYGIALDGSGNVYVTGITWSTDFPTLHQYQAYQGNWDAFVTKLDPYQSGAASLLYSTYLGGGGMDRGVGIAIDGSGNVYVTGSTESTDFPTLNPYQAYQGNSDVFVAKLDPSQSGAASLLDSTFLGGGGSELSYGIAVDGSGYAYVTGETSSTDFPTINQYQVYPGDGDLNVFVTKLDLTQSGAAGLLYSTYLGGGGTDRGCGIAVDGSGNAYVTGLTYSTDFPTLNPYQVYQGNGDIFVAKLSFDAPPTVDSPTVTTASISNITSTSADGGGNVTSDGGATVTARGVCWSTSVDPTTADSTTSDGTGTGAFTSNITGLIPGVTYHVRAYATNSVGTSYGSDVGFTTTAIPPGERTVLIALYNSTDGDNWTNNSGWKTPPLAADGFALPGTENTWYGITFDSGNTTVQSIDLQSNNLVGTLPPEVGNLANLQYLDLSWNHISGSIPPELASLANLYYLYLQQNQFSGSIPPELASLDNLLYLYLNGNQLSGSIPPELANLLNLQELWLFNNHLSGTIPPGLGSLANLRYLYLDANQLSGSIPPELGNLANLNFLGLGTNQFSGTIPLELTNLAKLQVLILSKNQLSGSIPPELGNLAKLEQLFLDSNQLSATIPPELGNLAKLYIIDLSSNSLSGAIPPELGNPVNLNNIDFSSNNLSGSIPLELVNLANLWSLDLSANSLSGSIPSELGNRANLHYLYLNSNQLSGSIPPELGNLANLREFHLNSNQLSGSIPSSLINLTNLYDGSSDLKWNALYTNDSILKAFLDSKQREGNWEDTQTIAPTNINASNVSTTSIDINWTPIAYTTDTGGYRVFYSTTPGGPYTYFGITADKTASSLPVTGLNPNTTYYFVVQTWTNPHGYNQNTVDSEYSAEVSAKTLQDITGLTLTSPNGGENWKLSSSQNITWNASGISGLLKITLWRAGSQIGVIANNINPAAGAYPWIVGKYIGGMAIPGADYKIKIKEIGTLTADTGNANFTLSPGITVIAPNGGQTWKIGNVKKITWRSGGLSNQIKITLWKDNVLVGTIANVAPAGGSFSWTVGSYIGGTAAPGSNYKIKIKEIGTMVSDTSDSAFTLTN